jgi:hypothetical protein
MAGLGSTGLARQLAAGRILRFILLVFLAAGLMAVSVIDADGDPATTNLPPVTLVREKADDPEQIDASSDALDSDDDSGAKSFSLLHARLSRILSRPKLNRRTRARPLRGP